MSFGCSGNRGQSIDIYSSMEEEFVNKKIVILNGSPREKGNTAALVNAFSKGAEEAGKYRPDFRLERWRSMAVKDVLEEKGGRISLRPKR